MITMPNFPTWIQAGPVQSLGHRERIYDTVSSICAGFYLMLWLTWYFVLWLTFLNVVALGGLACTWVSCLTGEGGIQPPPGPADWGRGQGDPVDGPWGRPGG